MFAVGVRPEVRNKTPADGKVAGFARIAGREIGLVSNDFTVLGASSSVINMKKIKHVKQVAAKRGLPLVLLGESSGARMPDRMGVGRPRDHRAGSDRVPALARNAVGIGAARRVLRLVDVVLGDVRFRRDAQGRDHGDRQSRRDLDRDQQADNL